MTEEAPRPAQGPWLRECYTPVHTLLGVECLTDMLPTQPISPMLGHILNIP